jgi:hypothetical protein
MPSDTGHTFESAPYEELFTVLLRQFKRPLKTYNVELSDDDSAAIARGIVSGKPDPRAQSTLNGLINVVAESEEILNQWGLSFQKSLDVKMDNLNTWESTAEFLELATEKSNAELRISAASALVMVLGDPRYMAYLVHLAEGDYGDETVIARRTLTFTKK